MIACANENVSYSSSTTELELSDVNEGIRRKVSVTYLVI
jgi:hypothetical protein